MEFLDFIQNAWVIAIAIIGFFIKGIIEKVSINERKLSKLETQLQLINLESSGKLDQLKETTELQLQSLSKSVESLVKEMHTINKAIMHLNGNIKQGNDGFVDLLQQLLNEKKK